VRLVPRPVVESCRSVLAGRVLVFLPRGDAVAGSNYGAHSFPFPLCTSALACVRQRVVQHPIPMHMRRAMT